MEQKLKILCPDCKRKTNHLVISEFKTKDGTWTEVQTQNDEIGEYTEPSRFIEEIMFYEIVQCQGCDRASYRQYLKTYDPEVGPIISKEEFYPIRDYRHKEIKDFGKNLPEKIYRLYKEVILTFNGKMEVLCAAGIRAVIEGICNQEKIKGGKVPEYDKKTKLQKVDKDGNLKTKFSENLDGKIEGLIEGGILSKNSGSSLHQLRFIGNEAVHQLDKPSEGELKLGIEILENTLESIYEIVRKGAEIEQHKTERKRHNNG